jgi:hypothetical protein
MDAMKQLNTPFLILVAIVLSCSGCKTLTPPAWTKGWLVEDQPQLVESKYAKPARLVVVWSPAVLNSPGQKPTRGFGGRIYFYDAHNKAVPVEGQLVVYGYDDTSPRRDSKSPDRKFAFTPEQFTEHYSPTELGASYSVWVPWDEVGGPQAEISLVPIFTATSGQLVMGQSSKNLLPGPTTVNTPLHFEHRMAPLPQMSQQSAFSQPGVQQAAFNQPIAHHLPSPRLTGCGIVQQASFDQPIERSASLGPSTTFQEASIFVPSTLAQRMAKAGPQAALSAQLSAQRANRMSSGQQSPAATASPTLAPAAQALPSSPTNQPLARFVRPARPAPSSPGLPPTADRLPTQPFPAAQPFAPPASTPAGPQSGSPASW